MKQSIADLRERRIDTFFETVAGVSATADIVRIALASSNLPMSPSQSVVARLTMPRSAFLKAIQDLSRAQDEMLRAESLSKTASKKPGRKK